MPAILARIAQGGRAAVSWFARRFPKTAAAIGLGGAAVALTDGQAVAFAIALIIAAWFAGKWALEQLT